MQEKADKATKLPVDMSNYNKNCCELILLFRYLSGFFHVLLLCT